MFRAWWRSGAASRPGWPAGARGGGGVFRVPPRPLGVYSFPSMKIAPPLPPARLQQKAVRVFELAGRKIRALDRGWDPARGTPVFTVHGRYTSRGWTEWTQ